MVVFSSIQRTNNKSMHQSPFRVSLSIVSLCFLAVSCLYCCLLPFRGTQHNLEKQELRLLKLNTKDINAEKHIGSSQKEQGPKLKFSENEITSEYVYATLMAGCDPSDKRYLGMMFHAISVYEILRDYGSTADFILMIRMAASTDMETLPKEEEKSIHKAGLKVMYLPKPTSTNKDNYLTAQMDKFHCLYLSKYYSKVIFMDADVMPLCNLDIFFEASKSGLIEKNVVISDRLTPANGGFFMFSMEEGDHEKAYDIIKNVKTPFDREIGWGHKIEPPDYFRFKFKAEHRHQWKILAANADQGFLYYWVKYVKKSVTIVVNNVNDGLYEDWSASSNGSVVQKHNGTKSMPLCQNKYKARTPWFHHFMGGGKPWLLLEKSWLPNFKSIQSFDEVKHVTDMWWYHLLKANKLRGLNLEIDSLKVGSYSDTLPLGGWHENYLLVKNYNVT